MPLHNPLRGLVDRLAGRAATPPGPSEEAVRLEHAGESLPLTFRRSARARRAALRVDAARRRIVLTAPLRMGRETALDFARANAGWIRARLVRMPAASPFVDGGSVPVFGVPHPIRHRPDARGTAWIEAGELHVAGGADHLRRRAVDFLAGLARREIAPLALAKAARLGRPVRRVVFRDTASRWGSCSADGSLMFSWRLVLAPRAVVDYVVAHEVAHLAELNHGPRFWRICAELAEGGEIAATRAWLKRHGETLLQYGV